MAYADISPEVRSTSIARVEQMCADMGLPLLEGCMRLADLQDVGQLPRADVRAFNVFMMGMGELVGPVH